MGDGTKANPLTREDVLRLIKENGGTAKGLDLSGKEFEEGIDLRKLDLCGIILKRAIFPGKFCIFTGHVKGVNLEGAELRQAQLQEAELLAANLQRSDLFQAQLEGAFLNRGQLRDADLAHAQLQGTDLSGAHLERTRLYSAQFSPDTKLENVDWGNYILGEENKGEFDSAADTYRRLKTWYTNAGMYDTAAEFYYREMEAKRKFAQGRIYRWLKAFKGWKFLHFLFKEKDFGNWVRLWVYRLTCGYGERPWQVALWGMLVLFGLALLYFFLRGVAPYTFTAQAFLASLYYSAVSFTALGYGPWFSTGSVRSWVQGVGAAEAIIGVFTIALFLITFIRKMTR